MNQDLLPKGEALRRAIRWISDQRREEPSARPQDLVQDASLRFDLSPVDAEFLWDTFVRRPETEPVRARVADPRPPFRAILCAVDFSEHARTAMRVAVDLAVRFGASLTLIHVFHHTPIVMPPMTEPAVMEREIRDARRLLGEWRDEAHSLGARDARIAWREGSPWHGVVQEASEQRSDLIVLGTHGRTGIRHALIGSVAERVVRHASCPVLTVPLERAR